MAIRYALYDRKPENEYSFEFGNRADVQLSNIKILRDYGYQCVYLEADGIELAHILNTFTNIPRIDVGGSANLLRWSGDHAKFIAMNLGV